MPGDQTMGQQREAELKATFTKPRSQDQVQTPVAGKAQEKAQEPRQGARPPVAGQPLQDRASQSVEGEKKGVEPSTPEGGKKGRQR